MSPFGSFLVSTNLYSGTSFLFYCSFFKDKEGNIIPGFDPEEGTVDKKEVPEYRFVESKKLPNGDTEHVLTKK